MTKAVAAALGLTLGLVLTGTSLALIGTAAHAASPVPSEGIYWESATAADGVRVRRMRDTASGVVCYVALRTEPAGLHHNSPAISCVH